MSSQATSNNAETNAETNAGLQAAAAFSARRRVRRLSQLEPVHIAALNQEYRTQIREAAQAERNSKTQREHYEKAKKIKGLLEKYEAQEQLKQLSEQPLETDLPAHFSPTLNSNMLNQSTTISDQSSSRSGSISHQMVANPPRHSYSQSQSPAPEVSSSLQFNQFNTQPSSATQENWTPFQQYSSEPLSIQLQLYKQLEKDVNGELHEVIRAMHESNLLDSHRVKLKQQEQNIRVKRDQYTAMVLTVTQKLQVQQLKASRSQEKRRPSKYSTDSSYETGQLDTQTDASQRNYDPAFNHMGQTSKTGQSLGNQGRQSPNESRSQSPTGYLGTTIPPASFHASSSSKLDPYKHVGHGLSKPASLPGKPIRIPGKVGRPPLSSTIARRMPVTSPPPLQPVYIAEKVFNKRKISELIHGLMPEGMDDDTVEEEVEELVGDLIEEFVANVTTFASRLAKHRKASHVEAKDVSVHLERNWNLRIPGFPGDEVSIVRRTVPSKSHTSKMDFINASKSYGGSGRN